MIASKPGVLVAALLSSFSFGQPVAAQTAAPGDLESRVESLLAAYGRADGAVVASFYAPGALILSGGNLLSGEQIRAAVDFHFQQLVAQDFDFALRDTRMLADDHAVTSVVGTTAGRNAAGEVIFAGSIAVSIHWRGQDGAWRIVYTQEDFRAPR